MIKIDLKKKLFNIGIKLTDFENDYVNGILDYEHEIVTVKKNNKGVNEPHDRFSLGIDLALSSNLKYKLEEIFFSLYNADKNFIIFVDSVFNEINNLEEARRVLEEILILDPNEMETLINSMLRFPARSIKEKLEIIFDYSRDNSKRIRPQFAKIDFRVCIYCNRNYTSNFNTDKSIRATFTLDHFHQKENHPILALSLYNLIPSCAVCNTNIKNKRNVEQYENPYSDRYNFEAEAKFKLMPNYKVKLKTKNPQCSQYIKDFFLNEVYDTHTMEIKEFVEKREVFTDEMIKKMADLTKHTEFQVKSFLFGDVISKEYIDNESLGKLKVDMATELKII